MAGWQLVALAILAAGFLIDGAATALRRRRRYGTCTTRPYRCSGCGRPADGNRRQGQTARKAR